MRTGNNLYGGAVEPEQVRSTLAIEGRMLVISTLYEMTVDEVCKILLSFGLTESTYDLLCPPFGHPNPTGLIRFASGRAASHFLDNVLWSEVHSRAMRVDFPREHETPFDILTGVSSCLPPNDPGPWVLVRLGSDVRPRITLRDALRYLRDPFISNEGPCVRALEMPRILRDTDVGENDMWHLLPGR
jgi:hypothetical protein